MAPSPWDPVPLTMFLHGTLPPSVVVPHKPVAQATHSQHIPNWVHTACPVCRYFNDTSILGPLSAATFRGIGIARRDIDIGYRMFRIFQTRANARGSEYLNLSGMELYGLLFGEWATGSQAPLPTPLQMWIMCRTGDVGVGFTPLQTPETLAPLKTAAFTASAMPPRRAFASVATATKALGA